MVKKIILSVLCGFAVMCATWIYQNYDFSFNVEDGFLKKVFFWKDKIYSSPPRQKADFLFINTGKDLALVEDTVDYGNVSVSDREKIYRFIHYIDSVAAKPAFTVIDIQFYYPYSINPVVDTLLKKELENNHRVLIPLVKDDAGHYKKPLFQTNYAYSDYRTFGPVFNKFRILNQSAMPSIPIALHQAVNNAKYNDHFFYSTFNDRLCLSSIWPSYYLKNDDVITGVLGDVRQLHDVDKAVAKNEKKKRKQGVNTQYYNIGEILLDMQADPVKYTDFFKNKIIFIGDLLQDVHVTPVGKMSGPVLLTNIYLSLLNNQHRVSFWFFLTILIAFSALSYVALFKKMPEVKFNFRFVFSSYVTKFIRGYISYFGCMFLLSLISVIVFDIQAGLFLPSFIFTGIEYIRQKKYKSTN
jgi:hypothetical protein